MTTWAPASQGAKHLLTSAAHVLHTADPVAELAPDLDETLPLPAGSPPYRRRRTFETRFSEQVPRSLAVGLAPGDPEQPAADRAARTTRTMRRLLARNVGPRALHWFDSRWEPLQYGSRESWLSSTFDGNGLREAQISYGWGPQTGDSLAGALVEVMRRAIEAMPTLRPALTSVRCGRTSGSQDVTFRVDGPLRLEDLKPLMERLGLGGQHTRLVNAVAFVLGARFVLPPGAALVTLRPGPAGVELRLDVDLEAIADLPPNVAALLQMQLVERPRSLSALEEWVAAMALDGSSPGALSVLSVLVRPEQGPRLAIDLRPSIVDGPVTPTSPVSAHRREPAARPALSPAPAPAPSPAGPVPVAAAARSPWEPHR